jgi:hypothetical protein
MIGLGKKKPGAAMDSEDESGDGSESAEDEAFQAAADAAKSGDGAAFKDAMKTAMELCYPSLAKSSYSEGESEEEG